MNVLLPLILLLPLAGALIQIAGQRLLPRRAGEAVACIAVIGSFGAAGLAMAASHGETIRLTWAAWMHVADFKADFSLLYDPTAAVMALMVSSVSSLIHLYSVGFMREQKDYARYFTYLNLFVFSMLVITLADDLVFLFLGWEGVGFCSYALIGFWYRDLANTMAGNKAFILTRIGDVAFLIAIAILFGQFHSVSISTVNQAAGAATLPATLLGLLLLAAAVGKSAQLPLSVWLPDAMAGPTPVSALIHAATMVTAGVYLLIRLFPLLALSPTALLVIAAVGTLTALYAACAALTQLDIKRVLAYSTISQVGYMFLGVGAGAPGASMFHLLCHAFFKALLFLAAGCVITLLHEEHDIYRMGPVLRRRSPALYWIFLAGVAALAAIPPSSGFFSKGEILHAAFANPAPGFLPLWLLAMFTAFLTALYSFRLFFLVFLCEPGGRHHKKAAAKPLPVVMTATLWPLAILAVLGGLISLPVEFPGGDWLLHYLGISPEPAQSNGSFTGLSLGLADGLLSLAGLFTAYLLYGPRSLLGWQKQPPSGLLLNRIFFAGFGLDALYQWLFVRPYRVLADFFWHGMDEAGIDQALLGFGRSLYAASQLLRRWSTGRLTTSLHTFFIGFAVLLLAAALKLYGIW